MGFGMAMHGLKSITAAVLGIAMMFGASACGTTDSGDDSGVTTTGFDVSTVAKDDDIAALVPAEISATGKLTVGSELTYAPAEFVAEDGKTPVGYDIDIAKAIGNMFGLETEIVSSTFDSIVPSVGSKFDLGITAMTITPERMESVDFVSYYQVGSMWVVQKDNPKGVDTSNLCGSSIAVQVGTVQEDEANKIKEQCAADGKDAVTVLSYKQQTDAATNVSAGKADVFYADSPVGGYAIEQSDGALEELGDVSDTALEGIAVAKDDPELAKAVQQAMQKLIDDGTYMDILKHWGVESGAIKTAEIDPTETN